jgi:hypothetical protein
MRLKGLRWELLGIGETPVQTACVYDWAGNVAETHEHKGEFTEARSVFIVDKVFSRLLQEIGLQRRSKAQLMNSF